MLEDKVGPIIFGGAVAPIIILAVLFVPEAPPKPDCDQIGPIIQDNINRRYALASEGLHDTAEYEMLEVRYDQLRWSVPDCFAG